MGVSIGWGKIILAIHEFTATQVKELKQYIRATCRTSRKLFLWHCKLWQKNAVSQPILGPLMK